MSNVNIEILNIKNIAREGNLKAIVDFKLNNSEFYSWRIIQQPDQEAWVSPPQESWEKDGKKHYKPLIKFSEELMKIVRQSIIDKWKVGN